MRTLALAALLTLAGCANPTPVRVVAQKEDGDWIQGWGAPTGPDQVVTVAHVGSHAVVYVEHPAYKGGRIQAHVDRTYAGHPEPTVSLRTVRPHGLSVYPMRRPARGDSGTPLVTADGEVIGFMAQFWSATERPILARTPALSE